jgi:flagellar motor component MotA
VSNLNSLAGYARPSSSNDGVLLIGSVGAMSSACRCLRLSYTISGVTAACFLRMNRIAIIVTTTVTAVMIHWTVFEVLACATRGRIC